VSRVTLADLWRTDADHRDASAARAITMLDGLITLALLLEIETEAWLDTAVPHRLIAAIAGLALASPLLVRRRWPTSAFLAGFLFAAVMSSPLGDNAMKGMTGPVFPSFVLAYNAGVLLKPQAGLRLLSAGILMLVLGAVWSELAGEHTGAELAQELLSITVLPAVFWGLGLLWAERSRRAQASAELLERVRAEREQHRQDAVARERIRIGQELQDIIAQNVSAIMIQAAGARQFIGSDPDRAREAILKVERAGSEALADLRRTLGLLRDQDEPRKLTPQPSLKQVEALLETARGRGLQCAFQIQGEPGPLSPGVDLVSYRIIETVLQGLSPASTEPVLVRVGYGRTRLDVEIRGGGTPPTSPNLCAISDRVELYDGTLAVSAPTPQTFEILAELPLPAVSR
jgi:signal transduction histidine kinase